MSVEPTEVGEMSPSSLVSCSGCATRNRVANDTSGRPRCAHCHADLPWLVEVGTDEFQRIIDRSTTPVLVDLWAPWCGPCRAVAPALEHLAVERAGSLRIVKVNVDDSPEVSARLGVQGIPTMVLFADGAEVSRQVGALPGHAIGRWIDGALTGLRPV
jgi:thioredoxin 2